MPEMFTIPIGFMTPHGTSAEREIHLGVTAAPVMRVFFRYDSNQILGRGATPLRPTEQPILALVDTGADDCYATPKLLTQIGCPATSHTRPVQGPGMTSNEYLYIGHLIIEGHGTQFEIDVFPQPLRENGRPFDLIIGRSILKQGVLLLDYINNRHTFSLPKG